MTQYTTGLVTVTNGSAAVTGTGTAWAAAIRPGDMLVVGQQSPTAIVAAVTSDTALTLEAPGWQGATAANSAYALNRDFDGLSGAPLMPYGATRTDVIHNRAVVAISNTIYRRTAGAVSPMSGGAAGDGRADDTAIVQAAITAAAGGIVAIDRPYLIGPAGLIVPANTTLVGSGSLTFRGGSGLVLSSGAKFLGLSIDGETPTAAGAIIVAGDDVELADFSVWGAAYAAVSGSGRSRLKISHWRADNAALAAVVMDTMTDVQVSDWIVNNAGGYGVTFRSNCTGLQISGGRLTGGGGGAADSAGIKIVGQWGGQAAPNRTVKIRDIIVRDTSYHLGVECWGGATDVVADNISVTGANGWGVSFDAVSNGLMSNLTATGTGDGVEIAACNGVTATNITGVGCSTALAITSNGPPSADITVSGAQCVGSTDDAVHIYGVQDVRIRGLTVKGGSANCFRVQSSTVDLRDSSLSTSSTQSGSLLVADNGSSLTVDVIDLRSVGATRPAYGIQAVNGSVITLGRLSGDQVQPQAVGNGTDGTDIRSLWGDTAWPTTTPLNAALPGALTPSVAGGCYSGVRSFMRTDGVRTIRFKLQRSSGRQYVIAHTVTWGGRRDDTPLGGVVSLSWGSYGAVSAPPQVSAIGSDVSITASALDANGYPYWDLLLPPNAGEIHVIIQALGSGLLDPWYIYMVPDGEISPAPASPVPALASFQAAWDAWKASPSLPYLEADGAVITQALVMSPMANEAVGGSIYQGGDDGIVITGGALNGQTGGAMVVTSADAPDGHNSGGVLVTAGRPGAGGVPGDVAVRGGPGAAAGGGAGNVFLDAGGAVNGAGGDVWIRAGNAGSTDGHGYRGGVVYILGGQTAVTGNLGGGDVRIFAGAAVGDASWVSLTGGASQSGAGGGISLQPGPTQSGYTSGHVQIRSADGTPRVDLVDAALTINATVSAGGGVRLDAAGNFVRRAYVLATVPAPITPGTEIYISDRQRPATADGSAWRWADGSIVS